MLNFLKKALYTSSLIFALNFSGCAVSTSADTASKTVAQPQASSGKFDYLEMKTGSAGTSLADRGSYAAPKCTHRFVLRELVRKPDGKKFGWDTVEGSFGYHVSDCKEIRKNTNTMNDTKWWYDEGSKGYFPMLLAFINWKNDDNVGLRGNLYARIKARWDGGETTLQTELVHNETFREIFIGGNDMRFTGVSVPSKSGNLQFSLDYVLENWETKRVYEEIPHDAATLLSRIAEMGSYTQTRSGLESRSTATVPGEAVDRQLYEKWFAREISSYFVNNIFPEKGGTIAGDKFDAIGGSRYSTGNLRLGVKVINKTKNADIVVKNDGFEVVAVTDSTGRVLQTYTKERQFLFFNNSLTYELKYDRDVDNIGPGYSLDGEVSIDTSRTWPTNARYLVGILRVGGSDVTAVVDLKR